jgi:4'-phosphopantetheinyl transferase
VEALPEGEAHLWVADPDGLRDSSSYQRYLAVLGPKERERHRRLLREHSRREFLLAHALARLTLSRYAPVPPEAWSFSRGEYGRPEIAGPSEGVGLRFNLSHTRGSVVCAVIRDLDIGVDVESTARLVRHQDLAERFFSGAEIDALRAAAPEKRARRFLEIWTLKEAYLKAVGRGISVPLRSFELHLSDSEPPRISFDSAVLRDDPASWQLSLHHPTPVHILALAIRRGDRGSQAVRIFDAVPEPGDGNPHR